MRIIYLIFLLGLSILAKSQVVTVTDLESGKPLEMATVTNKTMSVYVATNANGQADISRFDKNSTLIFQSLGFHKTEIQYIDLEKNSYKIALKPEVFSLDQVVVSATKTNQTIRDIPSKVSIISAKSVALQNPQTVADMLAVSGDVYIQKSQQGGGSPMIRGFSTNRLLYVVDGVRMNTAIFRSGNLQNVISLDAFAIENAEVLFGSNSVIYGSDAIGGVMNFQTLTPQFTLDDKPLVTGKAVTRYSSANSEQTYHLDLNVGWKKFSMLTSVTSSDFGNLKMGSHGPAEYLRPFYVTRADSLDMVVTNTDTKVQNPTGYSQINFMEKLRYKPNNNWDLELGFHYSETSSYSRYDRLIRTKNGLPRSAEWLYGPQIWNMNNLSITHLYKNAIYDKMTVKMAHQYFEESRIDRDFNKATRYLKLEKVNAISANIDFVKIFGEGKKFFYGIEAVHNIVESSGTDEDITTGIITVGSSRYPQSTWSSYGAYADYQHKISKKLMAQVGARYNYYSLFADFTNNLDFFPLPYSTAELGNGALTGTAGIVFTPTENTSIYANFSTGFRSPNVDDMGKIFDSSPGSVLVPNADLEAEYSYNAEVGIAKIFAEFVKVDVSAYYTILENALVRRDFQLDGQDSIMYDGEMSKVEAIQNAAVANVYGVQGVVEINLGKGFVFSSQLNYQVGEEELDDGTVSPSRHAAPMYGNTKLTYSKNNVTMQLYSIYNGEKSFEELPQEEQEKAYMYATDINGNPYSPAWYTLNFKMGYQFTKNLSVNAGIENLTDQRYRPYSSGIVAPGRNFVISMRANF